LALTQVVLQDRNSVTGIKVCGITREQDLRVVGRLGVQAIGIVFTKSPRQVLMGTARELVTSAKRLHIKPPEVWGVFANEPVDMIKEYVEFLGLDAVQLHGAYYTSKDIKALKKVKVVRGLNFSGLTQLSEIQTAFDAGASLVLLDAPTPTSGRPCGGTGRTVDWNAAGEIAASFPTVLSGGLNYRNVAQAIRIVHPAMVDVSSGVEMAPGVKDAGLIECFVQVVNRVG